MSASETVTLRGGCTVTLAALRLAWALEERGCSVLAADDGALVVRPGSKLTPADDQAIRSHRDELLALVRYVEREQ